MTLRPLFLWDRLKVIQIENLAHAGTSKASFDRTRPLGLCRRDIAKRAINAFLYKPWLAHAFMCLEVHPNMHLLLSSLLRQVCGAGDETAESGRRTRRWIRWALLVLTSNTALSRHTALGRNMQTHFQAHDPVPVLVRYYSRCPSQGLLPAGRGNRGSSSFSRVAKLCKIFSLLRILQGGKFSRGCEVPLGVGPRSGQGAFSLVYL